MTTMSEAMVTLGETMERTSTAIREFTEAYKKAEPASITFTTKMGNFTFHKNVQLSKAKLIRDSVMGQFFSPKTDGPRIKNEADAHNYVRSVSRDLEGIPFSLAIDVR